MAFIVGFLTWYLAVGFLIGAISLNIDAAEWDGNIRGMFRYMAGMLIVSMIAWFPLTLLYIEVRWQQRRQRRSDRL